MLIRKTGIVLSKRQTGDADIIIEVLTEDGELVPIRIHGIRKSTRRSALIAEAASEIEVVYYSKESVSAHKEAVVKERFERIKSNYELLNFVALILKLARSATDFSVEGIYLLTLGTLQFLNGFEVKPDRSLKTKLMCFYSARLLYGAGLMAESSTCSSCGNIIERQARWLAFSDSACEAAFECESCSLYSTEKDSRMANLLTLSTRLRFGSFQELSFTEDDLEYLFQGLQRLSIVNFGINIEF